MGNKVSVLISIFNRKGGEGKLTRVLNEDNIFQYRDLLSLLEKGERGLIVYYKDEENWLLLTSERILTSSGLSLLNSDIIEVAPALKEEFKNMVMEKVNFTKLIIKYQNGENHILSLERGKPYEGFYQVLHFIAGNNRQG